MRQEQVGQGFAHRLEDVGRDEVLGGRDGALHLGVELGIVVVGGVVEIEDAEGEAHGRWGLSEEVYAVRYLPSKRNSHARLASWPMRFWIPIGSPGGTSREL